MNRAKLVSSQFIRTVNNNGKTVSVERAKETSSWKRAICHPDLQAKFAAVVEENLEELPPDTTMVALK
jgi:hypothetical protein